MIYSSEGVYLIIIIFFVTVRCQYIVYDIIELAICKRPYCVQQMAQYVYERHMSVSKCM